ncbi:DegT/DnrJ/EryC1/StrS family aminotransferase [Streptomyces celluloflavus]|uniref:DegT/DnrJ/EryC1/StrS family aminotransferase n=1 Tax=Streptomyces celluloflavus TaxID=58344 RepID=UPI00369FEA72
MTATAEGRSGSVTAAERLLWPWWSEGALETVRWLLEEGDMAAAGPVHPQIGECEQIASAVLAGGRPVMMCDSGTGALETAYAALRLEPGSEVLVASASFRTTVTAMLPQRLVPVLCDVDPVTGAIDLRDAAARLTPRTAALTVTHLWGRPVPLDAVREFCDRHHLALLEDCSHAHGARWRGRPVGTAGDVAIWSTGTWKPVSGGRGGLLTTADRTVWERALVLAQPKHRALRVRDEVLRALAETGAGHNRRATPIAAVLAADHLRRLPHTIAIKNERTAAVERLLAEHLPVLVPLPAPAGLTSGALYKWHWRLHDTDLDTGAAARALRTAGVRASRPARPLHQAPLFTDPGLGRAVGLAQIAPPDPSGYPGTAGLLERLVEIDTRDMYDPLPDGDPDPYELALTTAATALHARTRSDRKARLT